MSRAGLRDDVRSLEQATGANRFRLGPAVKRDAQQFLNSAEYEFRKVVGAPRTLARTAPPEQHAPLETPSRQARKPRKASDES